MILKRLISRETRQDWPLFDILFIFLITNINGLFDMVIFSLRTNMLNNLANTGDTDLIILRKSKSVELLFLSKVQTLKFCNACSKKYISFPQYTKVKKRVLLLYGWRPYNPVTCAPLVVRVKHKII